MGGGRWIGNLTFAAEDNGQIPELGHVESFKDLALVACPVTVQAQCGVIFVVVLVCKRNPSPHWDLSAHNTVSSVETFGEHVHRAAFAIGNTFSPAQQLANDALDRSASH